MNRTKNHTDLFLLRHKGLVSAFLVFPTLIASGWMLAHIDINPLPEMPIYDKFFFLTFTPCLLYWFCFHTSQKQPEKVRAFCYAYAFPLVVMSALLITAELLGSSQASTSKRLIGYAAKFQEFALEPIPEFYGLSATLGSLLLLEVVVKVLTVIFGIPAKSWLTTKVNEIPKWYKRLVFVGILRGIGINPPYRSYLYYIVGTCVFLAAKAYVAFAGGLTAISLVLLMFPHTVSTFRISNFFELWSTSVMILAVGGTGAAIEMAWDASEDLIP